MSDRITDADRKRFELLREVGCICCRQFGYYQTPEIHHLNLGGHAGQKRLGHQFSIPACAYHHRGQWSDRFPSQRFAQTMLGPSLALEPRRFREVFGSDDELLVKTNDRLERL